ncbi:hypothetical protein DL765_010212 [Monosporascus sp. GIB2]|nr:hypothetical protein DL765_010212 [Monosporascus sp. GIB2]
MNCLLHGKDERLLATTMNESLLSQEIEENIRYWSNCDPPETFDESKGDGLVTLFENMVAGQPSDVAILNGELEAVSYDDFDRAAAVVALELSWIEPNGAVCVFAARSVNWLVAILGVLQVGGVYAPLNPSAPMSRRLVNFIRRRCTRRAHSLTKYYTSTRLSSTTGTGRRSFIPILDTGATLRPATSNTQKDPFSHLRDSGSAILTPSVAKALDHDEYTQLKTVCLVGEAVAQSLSDAWTRNRSLYYTYGPTEAICGATIKQLLPNDAVSLGRANPSSGVYILDRNHCLLPPGAAGELYLAGIQVSYGYINLPELNANSFLDDSVMPGAGQKMYRTGDYAYWDSTTGEICILGRKDRQIKLNGFRLDLDDLEARVVKAIPGCRGAAIFRREDRLIGAYQAPSAPFSAVSILDVKTLIGDALPPYAMPRSIIALDEFPLTVAGKLDYKTLEKVISHQALISAWNIVLERHSILRCRFRQSTTTEGSVERFYATEPPKALYVETLDARAEVNTEFSLETEDLIRVLISKRHMVICVSHIICDYTTLDRLLVELTAAYLNVDDVEELSWVPPQRRYQDTTCWNLDVNQATATFWKSYLSGIDLVRMPPYMRTSRTSYHGESLLFRLSSGTMSSLETVPRSLHLTLHQIALAIVSLVLQVDSPTKQDLLLGSPYLGRQEYDMRTIGLFLQPLPIRIRRQSDRREDHFKEAPLASFLQAVQESARYALSHSIEWSSLMNILSSSDDEGMRTAAAVEIPNHPLFDAMVTFHELSTTGQLSSSVDTTIPRIRPLVSWTEGAKFGIMFEFSAISSSSVTLRVEYDTSLFSSDEVRLFAARIDAGLGYLCQNPSSIVLGELERRLCAVGGGIDAGVGGPTSGNGTSGMEEVEFGTFLAALA